MTNRERIVRTLCCEATDRAPFGVGIGFAPWWETYQLWCKESGIADLNLAAYFGYDDNFDCAPVKFGPCPEFEAKVISEDSEFVTTIDYRGLIVRNRRDGGSMPEFIGHPLKGRADWEIYRAERLQPQLEVRLAQVDGWAAQIASKDCPRQFGSYPWGAFGTLRDLFGAEETLLLFYDDPELVQEVMQTLYDLWLQLLERVCAQTQIDHVHIWEDMSGKQGSLISMEMAEEFMMPQYDRVAALSKALGIKIISVDTDGKCDELVKVMHRHGVNAMLPFEVQAGNDIEWFRKEYPQLGIIGGLDKSALAKDKAAINRELAKAERMLSNGGYIPGCDHLIPPDVSWANWKYFVEELRRIVGA